ncbi:MAG: hypothetical protein ACLRFI_02615, partial [Alphaproteobacteria bacterium]
VFKTVAFDRSANHPKLFSFMTRRSFNLRFCSLGAPDGAAHHSFALGFAERLPCLLVCKTVAFDRSANHPKLFSFMTRRSANHPKLFYTFQAVTFLLYIIFFETQIQKCTNQQKTLC